MSRMVLSPDEQRLVLMAKPLQAIQRPAFRGHPFRLAGETIGSHRSQARFSEALVLSMIDRGLLTVTQCAKDLPVRDEAGTTIGTIDRPFAVILSEEGDRQRGYLLGDRAFPVPDAANDTAGQGSAAA